MLILTLASLSANTYYYYLGNTDVSGRFQASWVTLIYMGEDLIIQPWVSTSVSLMDVSAVALITIGTIPTICCSIRQHLHHHSLPLSTISVRQRDRVFTSLLMTDIVAAKDFDWTANWSYSHFKDEITELTGGVDKYVSGTKGLSSRQSCKRIL